MNYFKLETMCKSEIIKMVRERHDETISLEDIRMVQYADCGYYYYLKMMELKDNRRIYECKYYKKDGNLWCAVKYNKKILK